MLNDDAGHRIYRRRFLHVYDLLVLGLYSRWVWRCPADRLVAHYRRNLGRRHLDVGPGTGYFLDEAGLPPDAEVTLLDPNPDVLTYAAQRLRPISTSLVRGDVRDADLGEGRFDSVAMNYVLHCLPGPMAAKAPAVANAATALRPDGVLFGATLLGEPRLHTRISGAALRDLNRRGVFDNTADTEAGLRAILDPSFEEVAVDAVGAVAIFRAAAPRHQR